MGTAIFSSTIEAKWLHFFKIRIACSHFADKSKSKEIRLHFSGKFLSNFLRHISHSTKKRTELAGVNLVTEVEQP